MTFTILGSGTHFPNPAKRSAGYLLQVGKNRILFDFGYGTLLRMVELKVPYQDIGHIFFTHTHEDHYLDVLPFLNTVIIQVARWGLPKRTIRLYGPEGFKKKLIPILRAVGIIPARYIRLVFKELKKEKITVGNTIIHVHPVFHSEKINAVCYRIQGPRSDIAYTGDLDFDEKIIPFLKGVSTLVIECAFPNRMKQEGHLTPREAGIIAQRAGVKKVVLTHRYPPCDRVDIVRECRREFGGNVIRARDGMAIYC